MKNILRLRHRSLSTERTYMYWLRSFYKHLKGTSPYELASSDVRNFMSYLAVEKRISASTQNQAFNAILFFFRHVLEKNIAGADTVRAKQKKRLQTGQKSLSVVCLIVSDSSEVQHIESIWLILGTSFSHSDVSFYCPTFGSTASLRVGCICLLGHLHPYGHSVCQSPSMTWSAAKSLSLRTVTILLLPPRISKKLSSIS